MTLKQYKHKRSFTDTPEPAGGKPAGKELRFVIQKHDASHLHYDFRLEMGGVLKSWAVPKGPTTDPAVKRLAVMVEDHPYDYKDFEGIIPEGNYGAGTVMVWDEGTYEPVEALSGKKAREKHMLDQLKAGSLKFILHGQKLKGEFSLVNTKSSGDSAWLLIKHKDRYARKTDIIKKDRSAKSGKTLEAIRTAISASGEKTAAPVPTRVKTRVRAPLKKQTEIPGNAATTEINAILKKAPKRRFPDRFSPMLATLADEPFDDKDWEYEIKWDGYRALAFMNKGKTALRSRGNKSFAERFYPIFEAICSWGLDAVVDGEIVVVNEDGLSDFNRLQNWRSEADGALLFYVFDLLWLNGHDLTGLTLTERKAILQSLIPTKGLIRTGYSITARGKDFFDSAIKLGLEGIIAKRSGSMYHPGERSRDWLKIKVKKRQELVIGGFTKNENSPRPFSSLLLGVYEDGKLKYAGKVGTGFSTKDQQQMVQQFRSRVRRTSPFEMIPDYNKASRFRPDPPHAEVTWLRPELVCEIHFSEVTEDGLFRHPSFIAMREDKQAKDIVREAPVAATALLDETEEKASRRRKKANDENILEIPAKSNRKTLLNPEHKTQVREIDGYELKFSHLDKVFWPEKGYTKRDMINYYYQVAPFLLPYLKDRPQSLHRFPNGINGKSFYQKDVTGKVPGWIDQYPYESEGKRKHFMLGNNEASLLFMANAGAIEMNPWLSTIHAPDHPDCCILDLDPSEDNTFEQVIETAQLIHSILEEIGVAAYCKTSGATGLHIYIPLGARYTYDQSQLFARWIAARAQQQLPFTSIERMTRKRKGKLYIDFLQNRPSATLAAPYSIRPKPEATVSMPLDWKEVKPGLKITDFTIANAVKRIRKQGDIFKPVLGKGIDLEAILRQIL